MLAPQIHPPTNLQVTLEKLGTTKDSLKTDIKPAVHVGLPKHLQNSANFSQTTADLHTYEHEINVCCCDCVAL